MVIPGTTKSVIKALQKEGFSVQQIAELMITSSKSVYEALNDSIPSTSSIGILAIQLYIKVKLAKSKEETKFNCNKFVQYIVREKKFLKKNEKMINNVRGKYVH